MDQVTLKFADRNFVLFVDEGMGKQINAMFGKLVEAYDRVPELEAKLEAVSKALNAQLTEARETYHTETGDTLLDIIRSCSIEIVEGCAKRE